MDNAVRVMAEHSLYNAPWCKTLTTVTVAACVLLVGMALFFVGIGLREGNLILLATAVLPLGILGITALFLVKNYRIVGDRLVIERLIWKTELDLNDLESASYDPTAMENSLRLFGDGGLFAFVGLFWNRKLGRYHSYATAPRLAVVLKFSQKTVVVTPEKPEQFVAELMQR